MPDANPFRRLLAYWIDITLLYAVLVGVQLGFASLTDGVVADWLGDRLFLLWVWIFLTISLPIWLYFILFESGPRQATLGKSLLGLQVTDVVGNRLGRPRGRFAYRLQVGLLRDRASHFVVSHTVVRRPRTILPGWDHRRDGADDHLFRGGSRHAASPESPRSGGEDAGRETQKGCQQTPHRVANVQVNRSAYRFGQAQCGLLVTFPWSYGAEKFINRNTPVCRQAFSPVRRLYVQYPWASEPLRVPPSSWPSSRLGISRC